MPFYLVYTTFLVLLFVENCRSFVLMQENLTPWKVKIRIRLLFSSILLSYGLLFSCSEERIDNFAAIGDQSFVPSTTTATSLNEGWFEIRLKNEDLEIIIYLTTLSEGSYRFETNYDFTKPVSGSYAFAFVAKDDKVFVSESGEIVIKSTSY